MQLVPGVRYVDLETDRGRFSSYSKPTKSFDEVEDISALQIGLCCHTVLFACHRCFQSGTITRAYPVLRTPSMSDKQHTLPF